jgi:DNA-binding winged helix-turn-helix (wHTH) protein/TolB-like protein
MIPSFMPRIRFGLFDFDPASLELRREGVPVRLQAQPARVLALLVARAGEVVTRETLREAVWGAGTFVDFERGLNFCVAQIRSALGDSADSPRFIRTVPKMGYQFIAPVEIPQTPAAEPVAAPPSRVPRWAIPAAAALLIGGALVVLATHPAPRPPTIAVCRFDNQTGDPAVDLFADALADNVVAELTASEAGRYGIIGNAAILRRPRAERDLGAIASSLHSAYVVIGQVQRDGDRSRVLAHLIELPRQTHVSVARFDGLALDAAPDLTNLARKIAADFSPRLDSAAK